MDSILLHLQDIYIYSWNPVIQNHRSVDMLAFAGFLCSLRGSRRTANPTVDLSLGPQHMGH